MAARSAIFRCDAGASIGGGHVARCLAVARALSAAGTQVRFAVSSETLLSAPEVGASGFGIIQLSTGGGIEEISSQADPVDLLLIDHYGLAEDYERSARKFARLVACIDDVPQRRHSVDMLFDPVGGFGEDAWRRVAPSGKIMSDLAFAIIRSDVSAVRTRHASRLEDTYPPRVMISFGKIDSKNATSLAIEAAAKALPDAILDVAISAASPTLGSIEATARDYGARVRLHVDSADYLEHLARAKLAIGAGGVSALERAALGIPSVIVMTAENQQGSLRRLSERGGAIDAGSADTLTPAKLAPTIRALAGDDAGLEEMRKACLSLVDGKGAARIAAVLLDAMEQVRE